MWGNSGNKFGGFESEKPLQLLSKDSGQSEITYLNIYHLNTIFFTPLFWFYVISSKIWLDHLFFLFHAFHWRILVLFVFLLILNS